jgi:hypothetical protein
MVATCNTGAGPETHRADGIDLLRFSTDDEWVAATVRRLSSTVPPPDASPPR